MITLVREPGEPYVCSTGAVPLGLVSNLEKLVPSEYIHPSGNPGCRSVQGVCSPADRRTSPGLCHAEGFSGHEAFEAVILSQSKDR